VSLEIEKGDVVGVIGRNGSGIKILSLITAPTNRKALLHGRLDLLLRRVASIKKLDLHLVFLLIISSL
jgi:ABC-type polysaccharide/polyol phosphate transport system ATPase subunit